MNSGTKRQRSRDSGNYTDMTVAHKHQYLLFTVADKRLALPLDAVDQVYSAVEIETLPEAPETVLGLLNVHGTMIVVLNIRKKLNLPLRSIELSDQLLIATVDERQFALLIDDVEGVMSVADEQIIRTTDIAVDGRLQLLNDVVDIQNLSQFLSEDEHEQLTAALQLAYEQR